MLVITALIKLQDGGPVIFRQTRVGRGGELFTLLKFRSMVIDAEARKVDLLALNEGHGALFKLRDDRASPASADSCAPFLLDELPQLFNVLRGSMSLVGPRPHLAHEVPDATGSAAPVSRATRRYRPWQVSGRSILKKRTRSSSICVMWRTGLLTADLQILWKTASAVLARRGAR